MFVKIQLEDMQRQSRLKDDFVRLVVINSTSIALMPKEIKEESTNFSCNLLKQEDTSD